MADEETPTFLDKINELVFMSILPNVINVKCGPNIVIPSLESYLIEVSGFFESMIELKKSKTNYKYSINISKFCVNSESLITLIQFANTYGSELDFTWSIRSTVDLLLLSDFFKLTPMVNDTILNNVSYIFTESDDNSHLPKALLACFIKQCAASCTAQNTDTVEIEWILKLLGSEIQNSYRVTSDTDSCDSETRDKYFVGHVKPYVNASVCVLAIWLKFKYDRKEYVQFFELIEAIQSKHLIELKYFDNCDDILMGLRKWIEIVAL